jgi:hypothetical protein
MFLFGAKCIFQNKYVLIKFSKIFQNVFLYFHLISLSYQRKLKNLSLIKQSKKETNSNLSSSEWKSVKQSVLLFQ